MSSGEAGAVNMSTMPLNRDPGSRMCLPATGTLVVTMADGTEQQIDLSQVKSAVVKGQ